MSTAQKSVAIIYGWAEGTWQSKNFCRHLEASGFRLTRNPRNADILFAHSSGCYMVPRDTRATLILLVGLPYWPGRSLRMGVVHKLLKEIKFHRKNDGFVWWLNKLLHNWWYILVQPQASYRVLTKHKLDNLPEANHRRVILLRPSDDTMMHPDIQKLLAKADYEFIELQGAHDDCWIKPEQYIDKIYSSVEVHRLPSRF
jgi:predicted RNA binding protein YcfA (HicA-like mRNA interferase family)